MERDQVWNDDGRDDGVGDKRGPQYVQVELLRRVMGGSLEVGDGDEGRYGMKAWSLYCSRGFIICGSSERIICVEMLYFVLSSSWTFSNFL